MASQPIASHRRGDLCLSVHSMKGNTIMNESTHGAAHGNPAVITVPGSASTLEELDDRDLEVGEDEAAVRPILDDARLQWFNGLATTSGKMAIGWHIKVGINPYLDETCGALAAQEGSSCEQYLVQHKRPDKDGTNDILGFSPPQATPLQSVVRRSGL